MVAVTFYILTECWELSHFFRPNFQFLMNNPGYAAATDEEAARAVASLALPLATEPESRDSKEQEKAG